MKMKLILSSILIVIVIGIGILFFKGGICDTFLQPAKIEWQNAEAGTLLVDYRSSVSGTNGYDSYYELVLKKTDSPETVLLEVHQGSADGEEIHSYTVPVEVVEKCYEIIKENKLAVWNDKYKENPTTGGGVVCRFYDGEKEVRVTTDCMPKNGAQILGEIRMIMQAYAITESETIVPTIELTTEPTSEVTSVPINEVTTVPTSEPTEVAEDSEEFDTVEERVAEIRKLYYAIQKNLTNYTKEDGGSDTFRYLDENGNIVKITATKNSYYDFESEYNTEYYYKDDAVFFVFLYNETEEHRIYLNEKDPYLCIRYIDAAGTIYDHPAGEVAFEHPLVEQYVGLAMQEIHWSKN